MAERAQRRFRYTGLLKPLPDNIRIASAHPGGKYHYLSQQFGELLSRHTGRPVESLATRGSVHNATMLLGGDAHLALLQTAAIASDQVAVVTPLYEDLIHIIIRRESTIRSMTDLAGRKVSIGEVGSGMRLCSSELLEFYEIDASQLLAAEIHFTVLITDPSYQAAIVTTGRENEDLRRLLQTGRFRLLSIPEPDRESLAGPIFRSRTIPRGSYLSQEGIGKVPDNDVKTLATTYS